MIVRKSYFENKLLFNLVTSSKNLKNFSSINFGNFLFNLLGNRMAGLLHTINDDIGGQRKTRNGSSKLILGEETILERINELDFEISMQSFFQKPTLYVLKNYIKKL